MTECDDQIICLENLLERYVRDVLHLSVLGERLARDNLCLLYTSGLAIRQPVSKKPLLDGAVRAFRVVCCIYTIADFRSAGTSFSRNAVLRE